MTSGAPGVFSRWHWCCVSFWWLFAVSITCATLHKATHLHAHGRRTRTCPPFLRISCTQCTSARVRRPTIRQDRRHPRHTEHRQKKTHSPLRHDTNAANGANSWVACVRASALQWLLSARAYRVHCDECTHAPDREAFRALVVMLWAAPLNYVSDVKGAAYTAGRMSTNAYTDITSSGRARTNGAGASLMRYVSTPNCALSVCRLVLCVYRWVG